ncbi:PIN domain-containing protein [Chryseobacterium sp. sg2396]|uniref:PIN domain-containing protein n=1 Tax=Chryseobacterium sp. sg2396 TaxID=3276280 RepID=UPI003671362A
MKNKFKGYYKPLPDDLKKIWDNAIFIFDTNVLFDFYRYSNDTVEILFTIFEKIKDNIWIPNWVGLEYHRGLEDRIKEQVEHYTSSIKELKSFCDRIKKQREHPFLTQDLQEELGKFNKIFETELNTQKNKLRNLIIENPIKEKIASIIGDNIGDPLTIEEESLIIENGEKRLSQKIPPGYIDYKTKEKRPGLDKYGDYILWYQILKEAKIKKKPFIFVTFDTKEDWYKLISFNNSKIIFGARPELVEEFLAIEDQSILLYPTPEFIDAAVERLDLQIDDEKLEKVKAETSEPNSLEPELGEIQNQNESLESLKVDIGSTEASSETEGSLGNS